MQHRDKRTADAIRDNVAQIITSELADPKIGFVTVTRCHITRDLKLATIYFTVMGDEAQQEQALAHLEHACGFIRRELAKRIKLRYLPDLRFALDELQAHEWRIGDVLNDLKQHETESEPTRTDENARR